MKDVCSSCFRGQAGLCNSSKVYHSETLTLFFSCCSGLELQGSATGLNGHVTVLYMYMYIYIYIYIYTYMYRRGMTY